MNTILALDIGTEYVKAAIARTKKTGLEIIGTGKARQAKNGTRAGAITDIAAVVASCEDALVTAEEAAGETAKLVVVGIAGELVKGNTTTVHYTRANANKPITDAEMDEIIKKVQQKSGDVARKTVALETGNDNIEVRLINSAIVSLTIDGYKISNPIGFKGSDVVIQFYTAFAPLLHVAAIEKVCAELNLELLTIAVEPFAVCRACLGDDTNSNFSSIMIDIGGGTTDIAVVDDGGIIGTETFGIGANEANTNPEIWLTGIEVALEDIETAGTLPSNIFLCGGGADSSIIQESLATSDWYKATSFSHRPLIQLITLEDIPDITFKAPAKFNRSLVTTIGLLRVGLDTLISSPENNSLKNKLAKLLQK